MAKSKKPLVIFAEVKVFQNDMVIVRNLATTPLKVRFGQGFCRRMVRPGCHLLIIPMLTRQVLEEGKADG